MSHNIAHIDYETFSEEDLKKSGTHRYAKHPSTDILCLAYAFNEDEPSLWIPGQPLPPRLVDHILDGGKIAAWNSEFERLLTLGVMGPKYGLPIPDTKQYLCIMTRALAMGLPGALANAAPAVGLEMRKDDEGRRIMLQLCKPRKATKTNKQTRWTPEHAPHKFEKLYAYCLQDVRVEQAISKRVVKLTPRTQELAWLASEVNDRGVHVDMDLIQKAQVVVEQQLAKLDREMRDVTGGEVASTTAVKALTEWLGRSGIKWPETESPSVAKDPLNRLLARDDLTNSQRYALELRREAAKTSTAKLEAFKTHVDEDDCVRGTIQFNGASTGRDAARGVQVQNFPRPDKKVDLKRLIDDVLAGYDADLISAFHGPPMAAIASMLRSCICARPGNIYRTRDLSQIEARMTAWLAGEETVLDAFRAYDQGEGPDVYTVAAAGIWSKPAHLIDKEGDERQTGKVSVLALGFGGGAGAYGSMAKIYQLDLRKMFPIVWAAADAETREKATWGHKQRGAKSGMAKDAWIASDIVKIKWRAANPNICAAWYACEDAAVNAVQNPGRTYLACHGKLQFRKSGSFLRMVLPSGRSLFFPFPRVEWETTYFGKRKAKLFAHGVDGMTRQFREFNLWGGTIFQNAVQAASADVMFDIVWRCEEKGYRNVMRIHDEGIFENPPEFGSEEEFHNIFVAEIEWAPRLPIAASGWMGERYRK